MDAHTCLAATTTATHRELDVIRAASIELVQPSRRLVADDRVVAEAEQANRQPSFDRLRAAGEHKHPRRLRAKPAASAQGSHLRRRDAPSSASWHDVIAPCWAAARLVMAVTVARSTPTVGVLNSVERNLRHLGQAIRDMTADSLTKAGSRGW